MFKRLYSGLLLCKNRRDLNAETNVNMRSKTINKWIIQMQ